MLKNGIHNGHFHYKRHFLRFGYIRLLLYGFMISIPHCNRYVLCKNCIHECKTNIYIILTDYVVTAKNYLFFCFSANWNRETKFQKS